MDLSKKLNSYERKISEIEAEIEKLEATVQSKKQQKKELEDKLKQCRLMELDELIAKSGKNFDEIKLVLFGSNMAEQVS